MKHPLPVTLVTGFLGAGKTSALHHYLSEIATGPAAVLVQTDDAIPLDARQLRGLSGAMSRLKDRVLEFTGRDHALRLLIELADERVVENVLIEAKGVQTSDYFLGLFSDPGIRDRLALIQVICVVDALSFVRDVLRSESRPAASSSASRQLAQVEAATIIALNKCDLVSEAERTACLDLLCRLNPSARWLETTNGGIPREAWTFPLSQAFTSRKHRSAGGEDAPLFTTQSLAFRYQRPFHPHRFWNWFQADHSGLLRVKGVFWLATRNLLVGGLSCTSRQNSCGPAGIWWAALPREEWPQDESSLRAMQETWAEPYGDRRQELALLGDAAALAAAQKELQECLLTDREFALSPALWQEMPDPFPAWDLDAQD